MKKAGKSQAPPLAKKLLSDGEIRDIPRTPKAQVTKPKRPDALGALLGLLVPGANPLGKPRTNLGGGKPAKPRAQDTPTPSRQLAIGERPVLRKTAAKMGTMKQKTK